MFQFTVSSMLVALAVAVATPAVARSVPAHAATPVEAALTESFMVEGMVCEGCVQTVTTRLKAVAGVKHVRVSLKDRTAIVTYTSARAKAGYRKLSQSLDGPFTLKPAAQR